MAPVVSAVLPSLEEVREAVGRLLSDPAVVQQDRQLVVQTVLLQLHDDHHQPQLSGLECCLHLVWERLNTGHWAQVWPGWRTLYGLLSLARVSLIFGLLGEERCLEELDLLRDLVKMCDLGLLLGGPDIMGGALEILAQNITDHLASDFRLSEETGPVSKKAKLCLTSCDINQHKLPLPLPLQDIPVLECPDIPSFVSDCKAPMLVTKLTGAMEDWPALASWSVERLRRLAGPRTVPVEIGRRYTDQDWTQQLMTVEDFAKDFLTDNCSRVGYLAQHQLLSQVPALREDIIIPDYCFTGDSEEEEELDINVWIGPAGTVSPAHTDKKHNVLCQVSGYKYVAVFYPDMTASLYPDPAPMFSNTSRVDLDLPDTEQFPLVKQLAGQHTILGPGEMLYIPPGVWHYVRSLDISFSVSFWWQ